ncbi:hypothetical protein FNV43_RR21211 [Rhamnella rubrinervis]|uniref:Transmembrane protein n=1 Tax=Rhamnella rubrinervis TaxID=2594499 RepID=A0A8K0E294_9ROSA|nr:hypothetical protein FNV43_RR21211 [Rhamnella rubrinervis]
MRIVLMRVKSAISENKGDKNAGYQVWPGSSPYFSPSSSKAVAEVTASVVSLLGLMSAVIPQLSYFLLGGIQLLCKLKGLLFMICNEGSLLFLNCLELPLRAVEVGKAFFLACLGNSLILLSLLVFSLQLPVYVEGIIKCICILGCRKVLAFFMNVNRSSGTFPLRMSGTRLVEDLGLLLLAGDATTPFSFPIVTCSRSEAGVTFQASGYGEEGALPLRDRGGTLSLKERRKNLCVDF